MKIVFPNLTKKQIECIFRAEGELRKAGIFFDAGTDLETNTRKWYWDWSLRGNIIIEKEKKRGEDGD